MGCRAGLHVKVPGRVSMCAHVKVPGRVSICVHVEVPGRVSMCLSMHVGQHTHACCGTFQQVGESGHQVVAYDILTPCPSPNPVE